MPAVFTVTAMQHRNYRPLILWAAGPPSLRPYDDRQPNRRQQLHEQAQCVSNAIPIVVTITRYKGSLRRPFVCKAASKIPIPEPCPRSHLGSDGERMQSVACKTTITRPLGGQAEEIAQRLTVRPFARANTGTRQLRCLARERGQREGILESVQV